MGYSANNLKEFAKGSSILVFSNIVLKAIQFLLLPLYTQYLTPSELGVSDSITAITSFLFPLLVMAFDSAFSAFYYEQGKNQKEKVFNTTLFFLIFQSFIPIVLSFGSTAISKILFGTIKYSLGIKLAFFSISVNLLFLPFSLLTRMQNRMRTFAIINIIASLTMIGSNIVFVSVFKWGYASMLMSTFLVNILQVILYFITSKIKISYQFKEKKLFGKMVKYAIPFIPMTVSTWILNMSNRYMLLHFSGEAEVGIYGIGGRFVTIINVVISGITTAYTSFAFQNASEENSKEMFSDIVSIIFVFLAGVCTTVSLFGKEVIILMTSSEYHSAYLLLPEMMFSQLAYALYTFTSYGIAFKKESKFFFYSVTTGAIVSVLMNLILLPQMGAKGAALTTLFGMLSMFFMGYYFSQKLYPCKYGFTKIMIVFIFLYGCSTFCKDMLFTSKIIIWIIVAAITLLLYYKKIMKFFKIFVKH